MQEQSSLTSSLRSISFYSAIEKCLKLPLWKVQAHRRTIFFLFTTIEVYQTPEQSANKHLLRTVANLKAQDRKKESWDTFF